MKRASDKAVNTFAVMVKDIGNVTTLEVALLHMTNKVALDIGRTPVVIEIEFPPDGDVSMILRYYRRNWLVRAALWTAKRLNIK